MAKTNESDVWGQDPLGGGRAGSTFVRRTPNVKQESVRDDWDDDDDEEEDPQSSGEEKPGKGDRNDGSAPGPKGGDSAEDSSRIWAEANKRAPMPELVVASSSTGQSVAPPPPAALQPTLRILKRPAPNTGASVSSSATSGSRGTLAEREVQYQEARSRIFGKESPGAVMVIRDPLGPASEPEPEGGGQDKHGPGRPAKGFGERRRK